MLTSWAAPVPVPEIVAEPAWLKALFVDWAWFPTLLVLATAARPRLPAESAPAPPRVPVIAPIATVASPVPSLTMPMEPARPKSSTTSQSSPARALTSKLIVKLATRVRVTSLPPSAPTTAA